MNLPIINNVQMNDNNLRISLIGELDFLSAPNTQAAIVVEACQDSQKPLVLDMCDVKHIDSAGIAVLIFFHKSRTSKDNLTVIVASGSQPERVLKLGKFETILTLESVEPPASVPTTDKAEAID